MPHPRPWGWKIAAYLWTKSIGAGVLMIAAALSLTGFGTDRILLDVVAPILALVFTGVTTFLLVIDLKRPERFLYLLTKPNPRSWLVLGGYILIAYGMLASLWLVLGAMGRAVPPAVYISTGLLGAAAAGYSAFLFAQAKGRDLWQSPMFLWHLLLQAVVAGAAALVVAGFLVGVDARTLTVIGRTLMIALVASLAVTLGEIALTPISEDVKRAHGLMTVGPFRMRFWGVVIGLGIVFPIALLLVGAADGGAGIVASALALMGMWFFEDLWVRAGQEVPLS